MDVQRRTRPGCCGHFNSRHAVEKMGDAAPSSRALFEIEGAFQEHARHDRSTAKPAWRNCVPQASSLQTSDSSDSEHALAVAFRCA